MAANEILPFANDDTGTNLLTQAEYLADPQREIGNQPGIARAKLANKVLRQSSLIAAAVAQFIADNQAVDVTDDLDPADLATYLTNALGSGLAPTLRNQLVTAFSTTGTGSAYLLDASPNLPALVAGRTRFGVLFHAANTVSNPTLSIDGLAAIPIKLLGAGNAPVDPAIGQIPAGFFADLVYDGTNFIALAGTGNTSSTFNHGQCYLSLDGAVLRLLPQNGNQLFIGGSSRSIPSAGVTLSTAGLAASTLYYIYAYMNAGVMTLEASATGHSRDSSTGVEIKTGDPTRTLVGMARTTAGTAWADSGTQRLVLSWFNRRGKTANNAVVVGGSTTSASFVETNNSDRLSFLTWANEAVSSGATLSLLSNSSGANWAAALGLDSPGTSIGFSNVSGGTAVTLISLNPVGDFETTEGFHFITPLARISGGATVTVQGGGTSSVFVQVQG